MLGRPERDICFTETYLSSPKQLGTVPDRRAFEVGEDDAKSGHRDFVWHHFNLSRPRLLQCCLAIAQPIHGLHADHY